MIGRPTALLELVAAFLYLFVYSFCVHERLFMGYRGATGTRLPRYSVPLDTRPAVIPAPHVCSDPVRFQP